MTNTYPQSMTASVLLEPRRLELQTVPVPAIGPNQVLVQVEAVGVCGSDTHFYESGNVGDIVVEGPVVLGHESAGRIVAVGAEVPDERIGERVSVEPQTVCRRCDFCKSGEYHLCREVDFYGAWPCDGSFADYEPIDSDFAHRIPDEMTFEQAALAEPVSVAVHAVRKAVVTAASKVLITGAGPIGVLTAQVARAFGATEIVISDPIENRRRFALEHGATHAVDPTSADFSEWRERFSVYIDASGSGRAIEQALPAVRPGGVAVLVGMGASRLELPIAMIQHHEITLTGTHRYVNTWQTALELIASGRVDVEPLVTGRYGLDRTEEALLSAKTDPAAIKTMVIPSLTAAA